jgi:hypothetical protein
MQLGGQVTQSNLSGASFTDDTRYQAFVTGGLFRRVDCGFQGGLVVDYLHEDWDMECDLVQLRGELSWMFPCHHELGFWFSASVQNDDVLFPFVNNLIPTGQAMHFEATDIYAFFYRLRFDECRGGQGRLFGGFTGESDGILGGDILLPINNHWAFQADFTYLIPEEESGRIAGGPLHEAWNISLNLVWYPGGCASGQGNYHRPLLNVANNGSFIINQRD